jgi:uncharacterized protein YbjT (DUF2867 family)
MRILITGGTGPLGQAIVASSQSHGHVLRVQSRRPRPADAATALEWASAELVSGEGLPAAVAGVDVIIHAASDSARPWDVDVTGSRQLAEAACRAGVRHLIYVSIVGIDQMPVPYYRAKLEVEGIVARSGVPYSILRATQFHSFVRHRIESALRVPFVLPLVTSLRFQSVATSEVADRLLGAAASAPGGRLRDFGGPEVLTLGEMAAVWKAVRHSKRLIISLPARGAAAAAYQAGKNTAPDGDRGSIRWRDWLRQDRPA